MREQGADRSWRPTRQELLGAVGMSVPDVIGPELRILFCGINPSLWSGLVGQHFAHPGNRFWKALAESGLTPSLLSPSEGRQLLAYGLGITNLVDRATAEAGALSAHELREGASGLVVKVELWRPAGVVVLGMGAYGAGFSKRHVVVGEQSERIGGSRTWVVPNPSGRQARYPFSEIVSELRAIGEAVGLPGRAPRASRQGMSTSS